MSKDAAGVFAELESPRPARGMTYVALGLAQEQRGQRQPPRTVPHTTVRQSAKTRGQDEADKPGPGLGQVKQTDQHVGGNPFRRDGGG